MRNSGVSIGLFTDDAVIYCKYYEQYFVKIRLENTLTKISNWCQLNCFNMNVDKTKFCFFFINLYWLHINTCSSSRRTRKHVNSFTDNMIGPAGCQISQCHQYCNLGVTLDECLNLKTNFNIIFKYCSYQIISLVKPKYILILKQEFLYINRRFYLW